MADGGYFLALKLRAIIPGAGNTRRDGENAEAVAGRCRWPCSKGSASTNRRLLASGKDDAVVGRSIRRRKGTAKLAMLFRFLQLPSLVLNRCRRRRQKIPMAAAQVSEWIQICLAIFFKNRNIPCIKY
jgi:hypothetical protein